MISLVPHYAEPPLFLLLCFPLMSVLKMGSRHGVEMSSAVPGDRKCVLDEHELYGGTQKVCAEVELEDEFILIATMTKRRLAMCA